MDRRADAAPLAQDEQAETSRAVGARRSSSCCASPDLSKSPQVRRLAKLALFTRTGRSQSILESQASRIDSPQICSRKRLNNSTSAKCQSRLEFLLESVLGSWNFGPLASEMLSVSRLVSC